LLDNATNPQFFSYDLSPNYDISSATLDVSGFATTGLSSGNQSDMHFSDDGLKVFFADA
jgi:hypothetical protein